MSATITSIAAAIGDLLPTIELGDEAMLVDVLPHPPTQLTDFSGFPSAAYFYETTESDYATVTANRRDIYFSILLYGVWTTLTLAEQYAQMYLMVDKMLDTLDNSSDLGIPDLILRPVPAEFTRINTDKGEGIVSRIRLLCSVDTNSNT